MLTTAIKYYVMVNLLLLIENHNFEKLISASCFFLSIKLAPQWKNVELTKVMFRLLHQKI